MGKSVLITSILGEISIGEKIDRCGVTVKPEINTFSLVFSSAAVHGYSLRYLFLGDI